jgi:hypothetical protein
MWYHFYIRNFYIDEDAKLQKAFQNRFCLPCQQYLELVEMVCEDELFVRWCGYKKNNKKISPVELLVLGLLRYLGRGWTFKDCEESTAIDKEVHCMFFGVFILFGSTVLYKKWIFTPVNLPEAKSNMHEYSKAGFPGCVGSSDCTHVITNCCEYNLKNNFLGANSSLTTRTFNLICNNHCRIFHSTNGGPGRWINQTMVWLDLFVSGIHDGSILDEVSFELLALDKMGSLKTLKFTGVYVICDNRYLDWLCTVPLFGVTNNIEEICWSKWLESMRKNVECTFGILKGRWRTLKSGVRLHRVDAVEYVWLTCCVLHNWLLEVAGLTEEWVSDVQQSKWDGELGCLDFKCMQVEVPNALARLSLNHDPHNHNYDSLGFGPETDVIAENRPILTSELAGNYNVMQNLSDSNTISCITNGFKCVRIVHFCPWVFSVDCW